MSIITTNENGQIFVDGKPFFPIGIAVQYWGKDHDTEEEIATLYQEIKAAGFNTIRDGFSISNDGYETSKTEKSFRIASDNNLKLLFNLRNAEHSRPAICEEIVPKYKNYLSTFAWEVYDEPPTSVIPWLEGMHANVKIWDPNHIGYTSFTLTSLGHHPDGTEEVGEWVATPRYPIRGLYSPVDLYITQVSEFFDRVYNAYNQKKPIAFWVQGREMNGAMPTFAQLRYMTYSPITHGATGILYYAYDHAVLTPPLWSNIKQMAGELEYIHDVLAIGKPTETVTVSSSGSVDTRFHKVDNKGYLIAVNNEKRILNDVIFTFPYYIQTVDTLFETAPTKNVYGGTTFTDSFDYLGVHVYELTIEEETCPKPISLFTHNANPCI